MLHEHCDRVPRIVGRREGDEPGVGILARVRLRGAGLARDLDARDLRGGAGTPLNDLEHELLHRRRGHGVHRSPPLLGSDPAYDVAVDVFDLGGDVRHADHAAGRDRLGNQRHLERRHRHRPLTDRRQREQRRVALEGAR